MKKSKLDIGINYSKENAAELQRTDAWLLERNGDVSASITKKLMSCGKGGTNISWNERAKVYNFSAGVVKFVYEKMQQRKTNRYIDQGQGTKEMRYGTIIEPLIFKAAKKHPAIKKFLKKGYTLELVGYKSFHDLPGAGASSDAVLKNQKGKVVMSVEMKACTGWGTHYERTFNLMDDKNMDFWQTQSQMAAWRVKKCIYIVAEPPTKINKYVFHEGDIEELYKEWRKECKLSVQVIKASKIHQSALKERIRVVNTIVDAYLDDESKDLRELTFEIINQYKNKSK